MEVVVKGARAGVEPSEQVPGPGGLVRVKARCRARSCRVLG